jgi:hypothetical protein
VDLVPIRIEHGEERGWEQVCALDRRDVARRAAAPFDEGVQAYVLHSFGVDVHATPCDMRIDSPTERGALLVGRHKDLFRMIVLSYLANAKEIPPTGRLVRPTDVKGGHRFSTGTHVLPLDRIAERFGRDPAGFLRQARAWGGGEVPVAGDAAVRLHPLPRVPVTLVLWLEDEEFPPRVDLYFDSTCEFQLGLSDVIWAVALLTCVVLLEA